MFSFRNLLIFYLFLHEQNNQIEEIVDKSETHSGTVIENVKTIMIASM